MKKQINDLLLKMQSGENCIGETANALLLLLESCQELKEKNTPTFEDWTFTHFIKVKDLYRLYNGVKWLNITEVLEMYNKEVLNL